MNRDFIQKSCPRTTFAFEKSPRAESKVNISTLKTLVATRCSKDSAIYDVMLTERDFLDLSEFLAKVDVWLKLLRRTRH
jgi:hypothetical protein